MQIVFHCTSCASKLETEASDAGASIDCPTCGQPLVVPHKGPEPGTTIGGFKLVKLIGRGGMGEVFLARQMSLDRMVALKLLTRTDMDGGAATRFLAEIRLTARLEHPYLVTAFEAGEDGNILYLAMVYIRGASLHELVRRNGQLSETDALILGRKVASALVYAWKEIGLLHRDIKPANILIDSNGEPRLADLGLAKCTGQNDGRTIPGSLLGTPNYMSSEQAEGRDDLDVRSDIYSLGATLYTAVTGRIPYEAASVLETLRRQATEPLPDPRTFASGLSNEFVSLLGAMLARDRSERPDGWEDLVARIDQLLESRPGAAGILPIVEAPHHAGDAARRPRSWQAVAGLAAGVVIAACVGMIVGLVLLGSGTPRAVREPAAAGDPPGDAPPVQPDPPPAEPSPPEPQPPDAQSIEAMVADVPHLPPEMRARVAKDFAEAADFVRSHPDDLEGYLQRLRALAALLPEDGPLGRRVAAAIRDAPELRQRAMDRMKLRLQAITAKEIKAGRFDDALAAVTDYRGPFAGELAAVREELAEQIRQAMLDAARQAAREALNAAVAAAADALVNGNPAGATEIAGALRAEADADPDGAYEAFHRLVADMASIPTLVLRSFAAQIGQDLPVEFGSGQTETLRIAGVDAATGTVIGRRLLREGFIERPFKPADLSAGEKLARVSTQNSASTALARGMILLDHGDRARAIESCLASGTPLGDAMAKTAAGRAQPPR